MQTVRVATQPIDTWNVRTFDSALVDVLEEHADLICNYFESDQQIFVSHDLCRLPGSSILRPANPHAPSLYDLQEAIGREMEQRTIRAFHYTRLTDSEVEMIKHDGVHLSTLESLRRRLDAAVSAGDLARSLADTLYAESPFHSDQLKARSGKFWMTSHPIAFNDGGVAPLMKHWGGEVASMWIQNKALIAPLEFLGKPRIVEVAVPMNATTAIRQPARSLPHSRSCGPTPGKFAFDVFVEQPLSPAAILAVHTKGEPSFEEMGRSYPPGYVDVDVLR